MILVQAPLIDGLICWKYWGVKWYTRAILSQVSPVSAVYSGRQVVFVPEATDGADVPALVLEALFWAEQDGRLSGVPFG